MRIRAILLTLVLVLIPTALAWADDPVEEPDPNAPIFTKYKEADTGGVHFRFPRNAVVFGKRVQILPVEYSTSTDRLVRFQLTRKGESTPFYDEQAGALGNKVNAIPLRDLTEGGTFTLRLTVYLPQSTTVVGGTHSTIKIS
jgi:hypothetical protein